VGERGALRSHAAVESGQPLTGELSAAEAIIDNSLPAHRARPLWAICLVAFLHARRAALSLPRELTDTNRWPAGSTEQGALRGGLAQHRDHLKEDEGAGA
jgi:hypothetical protein